MSPDTNSPPTPRAAHPPPAPRAPRSDQARRVRLLDLVLTGALRVGAVTPSEAPRR